MEYYAPRTPAPAGRNPERSLAGPEIGGGLFSRLSETFS